MLEKTGIPTKEQIDSAFPSEERMKKGPFVVVECFQKIPCNPCFTACNRDGIKIFEDINDLPNVDHENCNGCTLCVSKCPGLAITVVDMTYSEDKALLKIPYEFLPLPRKGDRVTGLSHGGEEVEEVEVVNVQNPKGFDKTPVISIATSKDKVKEIRSIKVPKERDRSRDEIVCRCSDVTLKEVRDLIHSGHTTVNEIKKISRIGMGPCQGRTCSQVVIREIASITGKDPSTLKPGTYRPVVRSVEMGKILEAMENEEAAKR
jgi:Fe-S-cluster-containing hydrogenase component 2